MMFLKNIFFIDSPLLRGITKKILLNTLRNTFLSFLPVKKAVINDVLPLPGFQIIAVNLKPFKFSSNINSGISNFNSLFFLISIDIIYK